MRCKDEHDMDMVGHDAPRDDTVALSMKEQEGGLDDLGDMRKAQEAFPVSGVLIPVDAFAELDLTRVVGGEITWERGRPARLCLRRGESQFFFPTLDQRLWQGVVKSEGESLNFSIFTMREVAAGVPSRL